MLSRSNILCCVMLVVLITSGCVSVVSVPEEAQLVWYGKPPVHFEALPPASTGNGQIYLYDDTSHKVVTVLPISEKSTFNIPGLKNDHDYALYFVPKHSFPSLNPSPATSPAQ